MTKPYQVVIILSDNILATSATLPVEMLKTAESAARGRSPDARGIDVQSVSLSGEPVTTSSGFRLTPSTDLAAIGDCDLVHLPGFWRNPRPTVNRHRGLLPWLRDQHARGTSISSVGTGCCYLAEAGLLDGKPATTHWHYFDQFQRDYPAVALKRQYFITRADNIYCAASVNSLAELMVNLAFRWYGKSVANVVQRNFFHEVRHGFEPANYYIEEEEKHPDEHILQVQIWMQDNFNKPVTITSLAQQFGMSVRTLNRRFKNALGKAPLDYLQLLRLNNIKELLRTTNLTLAEIARRCGYQDVAHLTKLFRRHFDTTPGVYRESAQKIHRRSLSTSGSK